MLGISDGNLSFLLELHAGMCRSLVVGITCFVFGNFFSEQETSVSLVYRYRDQSVALKLVQTGGTPEEVAKRESRFSREVSLLSRVQHKNLVKVCYTVQVSTFMFYKALSATMDSSLHCFSEFYFTCLSSLLEPARSPL